MKLGINDRFIVNLSILSVGNFIVVILLVCNNLPFTLIDLNAILVYLIFNPAGVVQTIGRFN